MEANMFHLSIKETQKNKMKKNLSGNKLFS